MKRVKAQARLERRRKAWDELKFESGFKRPGSNKKVFPRGKR